MIDKTEAQPEALRVAAWLINAPFKTTRGDMLVGGRELRRLHAETEAQAARIAELEAQLSARQAAPDWIEDLAQSWDECMYDAPGEMIDIGASIRKAASRAAPPPPEREPRCWCETCRPVTLSDMRMVLCPDCGNKRCPKATHHDNACTKSNAPGQTGSSWEHVKPHGATND